VYVVSADRSWRKLEAGDDFIQWTLRCGHVLFDETRTERNELGETSKLRSPVRPQVAVDDRRGDLSKDALVIPRFVSQSHDRRLGRVRTRH